MRRRINKNRQMGSTKVEPEQAKVCKFYNDTKGHCRITINGELICSYKRCTLCIKRDRGDLSD